jgi:large subunit ribosomal protein L10
MTSSGWVLAKSRRPFAASTGSPVTKAMAVGPTAIAFVTGDPVEAAKGLRDFARTNPLLVIKGGVLDGKAMTAAEITTLADLESREVLLAKLAGAMNATLTKAVYLFAAPLSQSARLIEALRAKREAEGPQDAAPQDAAPQDTAPQDAAAESTTPQDAAAPAVESTPQDVATGGDTA